MSKVLIVDDERNVLAAFESLLAKHGYDVLTAGRADEAPELVTSEQPDVVIMDIHTPGMSGLDALEIIKQREARVPVIIITGYGTMETAIEATKRGAFDYQLKPLEPEEMLQLVERAAAAGRSMHREVALGSTPATRKSDAILGQSPAMQELFKMIGRVAPTDATVLIRGESGTGKELVARAIYQHSRRNQSPLVVVNCAALPEALLESEFFGHERGAFTGAVARRIGRFEQARGGTIFLDEIGEMPLQTQAKLLRVVQNREFEPLGSNETIKVDVRILAATNRDLEAAIAAGRFREDLFHRLSVVALHLPPLRERWNDVSLLVDYFLQRFAAELGKGSPNITAAARDLLATYHWPGNVRELENCLQRLVIVCQGRAIELTDIKQAFQASSQAEAGEQKLQSLIQGLVSRYLDSFTAQQSRTLLVEQVELQLLKEALQRAQGNQTLAAKLVGLPRSTFYARLQKFGLVDVSPLDR
ncbi:MAG TPA: sigma-54 dependent transcriptional regulator [Pirellulaceae bacterium]|jgi:nitrogen regulation protein NR(I)